MPGVSPPNPHALPPRSGTNAQPTHVTFGQLKAAWTRNGGNPAAATIAAAIAMAESGGDLFATHTNADGSIDRGPWQVNSVHGALSQTGDLDQAARAAIRISRNGADWNPWTTFKSGAYQTFLHAKNTDTGGEAGPGHAVHVPVVSDAANALGQIGHFIGVLLSPRTWLHVLEVIGGAILIAFALATLSGKGEQAAGVAMAAAKVAK